jgi:hypothetical protein
MGKVRAKIDTGAYTGALHCTKIEEVEGPEGKILHFSPFDKPKKRFSTDSFVVSHVKSSNGKTENRYFITTDIAIDGQTYPILLSLANRSEMKWPVLIGRRFLRTHNFVVDATIGRQYRNEEPTVQG